ncbi:MAG: PEP/pyruvate-binding domain-containing protein [Thermoanaerobaculia bacterium]
MPPDLRPSSTPLSLESPWTGFQDLMPWRVQDILLVSSLYDSFILAEDGQLNERILAESLELNLRVVPRVVRVSTGAEALALLKEQPRFNLVVTSLHVGDMDAVTLAGRIREADVRPHVVLLAYDNRELEQFTSRTDVSALEGVFLWRGDVRILLTIVKTLEDRRNAEHDVRVAGVQLLIVIEDQVPVYSSFLPVIYAELFHHSHNLVPEGINLSHKLMRLQARPKILLCRNFEEAWEVFSTFRENVLGIISDIEFPKDGVLMPRAGVEFAQKVRDLVPDIPVMLQSGHIENEALAREVGASFQLKGSPLLLQELRHFMVENFGFGDFIFRLPDGTEVGRAGDLKALEEMLWTVPAESLAYHGQRNHFSNWLKARTEFALAHSLRPRKVEDFGTIENLRRTLIGAIHEYRKRLGQRIVADFDRTTFDGSAGFVRIGGGSLGGKARGLAFVNLLLEDQKLRERFPLVRISVPPAAVLGTDVFDRFLEVNDLRDFAISADDDTAVLRRFLESPFPEEVNQDLGAFLQVCRWPLAVRSSSLLEDSQYQPFAGVYETIMLPNNSPSQHGRLSQLQNAIRRVYASTFSNRAKAYLRATPYRLEEEKMAVILQRLVGSAHSGRFYPSIAGVARSHNFYPSPPGRSEDGIAGVALGFGESVVDGDACVRFCPRFPQHIVPFSSVKDIRQNSQREFYALRVAEPAGELPLRPPPEGTGLLRFGLETAEQDGTLDPVGSTYSHENDAVYDGISRPGVRIVTFAPILKHGVFPLAEILAVLLEMGADGTGAPVEIEFAANLSTPPDTPKEFGFLQLRPLAVSRESYDLEIGDVPRDALVCQSRMVLGNGRLDDVRDLVVVDFHRFDRNRSLAAAAEVAAFNHELSARGTPYLLIGVGRWGSADPFLGIPVRWDQISGARVIVEAGFRDFRVTPSQGTHFFQNLVANSTGYFTVNPELGEGFVDWEWLAAQSAAAGHYVRHIRLDGPCIVKMNGRRNEGIILKPGRSGGPP